MKLITKSIATKLPKLYAMEFVPVGTRLAYVKLFHPMSNWTWYVMEYDGQDLCFGLVFGHEQEFGYFSLNELNKTVVHGVGVERDEWFQPTPIQDLLDRNARRVAA
jgi:hypothetical protein